MKNLNTLLIPILLATSSTAFAQGPVFGIKAGLNDADLYSTDLDDRDPRFGFHGGVFGRTDPEQQLGLQVELLYSARGTEFVYNGFIVDQRWTLMTDYIDLPVMLGIRLGDAVEVNAGAYAGYLVHAQVNTSGDLGADQEELDRDNFKQMDYGMLVGLSVNVGPVQVGARYNLGLAKLADSDEAEMVLGDAKHSFAQVYLAFGIPGGD